MQLAASNEKRAPVTVHYHHYNELPPIKPVAVPPLQVYDLCVMSVMYLTTLSMLQWSRAVP